MSIPSRLSSYLERRGTHYEICVHEHSRTSAETAHAAHVPPNQLAKPVILEDDEGCVMAVIPADKTVMLGQIAQLLTADQLHRDEADPVNFVDFVDDGDVRMFERGGGARFLDETLTPVGIGDQIRRQDLERDLAIQFDVEGAVDDAHAAPADLVDDLVAGERAPDE